MSVFIDPPVWPAHGTVFSHLISDTSLEELHAFAETAELSPRAFDLDHYDVPAHEHDRLVSLGAQPVSGHELVRILTASGLRVQTWERPEKVRPHLQRSWQRLGQQQGLDAQRWQQIGEGLLARWAEPHRNYHGLPHLAAVTRNTGTLTRAGELAAPSKTAVLLAGWYHDAVYAGTAGQDEEDSACLAEQELDGMLPDPEVAEIARLVRLTATHIPENDDETGAVLVDADLEVLGRDPHAYQRYLRQVRADYAHVPDDDFARGRSQVLQRLLQAPRLFHSATGYARWEEVARQNLETELADLQAGRRPWLEELTMTGRR